MGASDKPEQQQGTQKRGTEPGNGPQQSKNETKQRATNRQTRNDADQKARSACREAYLYGWRLAGVGVGVVFGSGGLAAGVGRPVSSGVLVLSHAAHHLWLWNRLMSWARSFGMTLRR